MRVSFRLILWPFSILYDLGTRIRNLLFDFGILKSYKFPVPVICVGNISLGGTGKTPHIEYLITLLSPYFKIAVLSRGYKRKTKGFVLAGEYSTAIEIGDEPYQIKSKFPTIIVAVDEHRKNGINMLLQQFPDIQYVLLDDAFQHRTVKPSLSIVLVDYTRPLSKDCLLPAGNLRESKRFIRRADIIIVTKCPNQLSQVVQEKIQHDLKILPTQKIFFSGINYSDKLLPVYSGAISGTTLDIHPGCKVLLVTGIANPAPLIEFIQQFAIIEKVMSFPDHYYFSHEDMRSLSLAFQRIKAEDKIILTTEKDASRFRLINPPVEFSRSLFYIPISVKLLDNKESDFYELLLNAGKQNIYI